MSTGILALKFSLNFCTSRQKINDKILLYSRRHVDGKIKRKNKNPTPQLLLSLRKKNIIDLSLLTRRRNQIHDHHHYHSYSSTTTTRTPPPHHTTFSTTTTTTPTPQLHQHHHHHYTSNTVQFSSSFSHVDINNA